METGLREERTVVKELAQGGAGFGPARLFSVQAVQMCVQKAGHPAEQKDPSRLIPCCTSLRKYAQQR